MSAVLRINRNLIWTPLPGNFRDEAAQSPDAVLLQTSRFDAANHNSYLFVNPVRLIVANGLEAIPRLFREIEAALTGGFWVAGYLAYECGFHFEGFPSITVPKPLAWFGVYAQARVFEHFRGAQDAEQPTDTREDRLSARPDAIASSVTLEIAKEAYIDAIARIKEHLTAGDTYQVNYTDRLTFKSTLSCAELFSVLSAQQPVAYSAFLNIEGQPIVSLSPELFFRTEGDRIVTRPMKGTMPRGLDLADDERMATFLRNDEKNCSEHVMIVDLLRNDLGRICRPGSVQVQNPFFVERYDTLHQMTSSVIGSLKPGISFYDIFQGLFPSGSITGAPKHRTMQIIQELERHSRGVYSGAIGFISPNRSSAFNVAIRTLVIQDGHVSMGVGGGIVADSDPEEEYRECLLKASFVTRRNDSFQLIETMLWDGEFELLNLHLDRMQSSALYFNFVFHREWLLAQLRELSDSFRVDRRYRVRVLLESSGRISLECSEMLSGAADLRVKLATEFTSSGDLFLRHKTTNRALYDRLIEEAKSLGFDEIILSNDQGQITEGAVSNIFIVRSGKWLTPPLECGLLPGVYRRHFLKTRPDAEERVLTLRDLHCADSVHLCNAVRGLRQVKLIC